MSAQRYDAMARYAFSFGEKRRWYNFYKFEWLHDRFALIDARLLPSIGLGYWWIDTADFKMMAEVGVGWEKTHYTAGRPAVSQGVAVPRFFVEKRIIGQSRLSLDISCALNSESETGQRVDGTLKFVNPISARLSLDLSLIDHYVSRPPVPAKTNDLTFVTALRYAL
jgi:putative salt-induced outer membrane protein YdiY